MGRGGNLKTSLHFLYLSLGFDYDEQYILLKYSKYLFICLFNGEPHLLTVCSSADEVWHPTIAGAS